MPEKIDVLVDGGKATAGPPLGPALGPLGLNIVQVVAAINERTKAFEGMKVPVTLVIDPKTKSYTIGVGTPPTSALVLKEISAAKGSGDTGKTRVGDLPLSAAVRIAEMKRDSMQGRTLKARVLEVIGTCRSMGVTVEGKAPKDIVDEIRAGKHDRALTAR